MGASYTLVIKDEGLKGPDSTFPILSWSWGVTTTAGSAGSGGGGGRAQPSDLLVVFTQNSMSPKLMEACASGKHIDKLVIIVSRDGQDGAAKPYLTIELRDVIIGSYQTGGRGDDKPIDQMSLNFGAVKQTYDASGLADKAKP